MELDELTNTDKFFLRCCGESPDFRYVGAQRRSMNLLTSYGLAEAIGNLKYCLTLEGQRLLAEWNRKFTHPGIVEEFSVERNEL